MLEELRFTGTSDSFYQFAINVERELFSNASLPIKNKPADIICKENIDRAVEISNGLI